MRRGKRDTNHAAVVKALQAAGRSVLDLAGNGAGAPDILVGWGSTYAVLMEIKNPRTPGEQLVKPHQAAWHQRWKGPPVVVVSSVEQALAATGVLQRGE